MWDGASEFQGAWRQIEWKHFENIYAYNFFLKNTIICINQSQRRHPWSSLFCCANVCVVRLTSSMLVLLRMWLVIVSSYFFYVFYFSQSRFNLNQHHYRQLAPWTSRIVRMWDGEGSAGSDMGKKNIKKNLDEHVEAEKTSFDARRTPNKRVGKQVQKSECWFHMF